MVLVGVQPELAVLGADRALGDTLDRALVAQPVADQVGDAADPELVRVREFLELRTARHGAVLVHDLDDDGRGLEAGEARQIATRLGMAGARQHSARLRHDREYVAGLAQVLGSRIGPHGGAHRVGSIVGGDARRHALGGLDREREVGAQLAVGVADHERQPQLRAALARQRQADQPAAVARHEVDVRGRHALRGHDQVALVLAILVVHDDDHAPGAQLGQDVGGAVQFHQAPGFS